MDENRIVYDRLQTTRKLHRKSRGTPKEETNHPRTIHYSNHGQDPLRLFHPTIANVPVRPTVNMGDVNFELKTGLFMMVRKSILRIA